MQLTHESFEWDDYWWKAPLRLDSWAGFQSRGGAYGSVDSPEPSDGSVNLIYGPEGRDEAPLSALELKLINQFLEIEPTVSAAVQKELVVRYPAMRDEADLIDEERAEFMPALERPEDLRRLIGLYAVNVHVVAREGKPYVGYEFGCTWDEEHGLGVLTHGSRIVAVGQADTAFLQWIAEQDAASE